MKRHLRTRLVLSAPILLAVAGLPAAATAQPETRPAQARAPRAEEGPALPIRSITLYRSGVGYFERRGQVEPGDRVQLRFATDQINDILKSMVILDREQALESVGYGSKEPLERRLASFGVNIADNPSAAEILTRLRGTPVRIVTDDGAAEGTILNVEKRPTVIPGSTQTGPTVQDLPWINLVTSAGVRSYNLTRVTGFELLDPDLAEELRKALSALADHHADRVKTVDLVFGGQGARPVVVAYVNEMPVWKTSYRLVLPEHPEGRADPRDQGGQPTIQGWAIVENTTDEDWENVRLGLVAGRPVSFEMDLYEPLYVQRPEVPVPTVPGVMPRVYQEGASYAGAKVLAGMVAKPATEPAPTAAPARRRAAEGVELRDEAGFGLSAADMQRYAVNSQAQAGETGEVFEYTLKTPVSIARQRSAMLPILASAIDGRRVSIYNRADGSEHPMRGVEIKNTTGLQLMPGPISVFDGTAYAGDAQIGHVTAGDKRLLAYAVDLDVQALTREEQQTTVRSIKIVQGLIHQTSRQVHRIGYGFTNKDTKRPRQILVEQPRMQGWDLVQPAKPVEETRDLLRFEVSLAPGESGTLDVVHERTDLQTFAVTSYDMGMLLAYAKQGKVSKAVVDAITKAAEMQAAINDTQRRIETLDQERRSIDQDQARIRQNMSSVSRDTDLYRRYTAKLNEQENRLEAIREERQQEESNLLRRQQELEAYLRGLNVE